MWTTDFYPILCLYFSMFFTKFSLWTTLILMWIKLCIFCGYVYNQTPLKNSYCIIIHYTMHIYKHLPCYPPNLSTLCINKKRGVDNPYKLGIIRD